MIYLEVQGDYGNMEIIKIDLNDKIPELSKSVACIGYFDGLHLGHQHLLDLVLQKAEETNCIPACICFDNDPWIVLQKSEDKTQLTPLKKRLELLKEYGIKRCFLLHFTLEMAHMSAHDFVSLILNQLHLHTLICGNDFHFAHKGSGNIETLKEGDFGLYVAPHIFYKNQKISSSIIEKQIRMGEVNNANQQLGKFYSIEGRVIHGKAVGNRILGFPTANIEIVQPYVIPKTGVYSGYVEIHRELYRAMINIGHNPTMNYRDHLSIEAHILDFNEDLYEQNIIVYFCEYLREEKRFNTKEELITQLNKDKQIVSALERRIQ